MEHQMLRFISESELVALFSRGPSVQERGLGSQVGTSQFWLWTVRGMRDVSSRPYH